MTTFLRRKTPELLMIGLTLLLFLSIFILFDLPLDVYIIAASIVLFISVIYWIIAFITFKKEMKLADELRENQALLKQLRNEHNDYRDEVESYFLLWVHQMKTPITAVKLLLEHPDDDMISLVRQEVLQIDNYTNLTLSYLKLMNTTTDMTFSQVKLDDLILPLLKKYSILFIHYHTKLHYEPIDDFVLTDARWSSIMVDQLLNNALKYARGGDIWITFDNREHQLDIRDNGVGISDTDLPKIFDRGFSGFNGRLNDKSSGLGLYITSTVGRRLNQPVTVKSNAGQGSTFTIHFKSPQSNLSFL
ncbi:sensor histidine kinase [Macrococcus equipercicus]|uniref:sensor histidine kinase n=1 Tax=Macrococcus equipercicus TaxID=69967 RepID=UPI003F556ABF